MRTSRSDKPHIVISIGDPSGVGPEITLKALKNPAVSKLADFTVVGNLNVLKKIAKKIHLKIKPGKAITFIHLDNVPQEKFKFGTSSALYGKAAVDYILYAAVMVNSLRNCALVTAPISKESINKAGFTFGGHTELLSCITRSSDPTMMLAGSGIRVSLVTRHVPLKDVPGLLTRKKIVKTVNDTYRALKNIFKIKNPRIAVAGLNPHAGDGGVLGKEEKRLIEPLIKNLRKRIENLQGPLPPDIAFYKARKGLFDAVVCMYHDQGLIPLKMIAFDKGVNITLGLPFVRTSPDHGTAFDIAGKGKANPSSMIEAIKLAVKCLQKTS